METRLPNIMRPKEEQWLIDAINEQDIESAESVIEIIKKKLLNTNTASTLSFSHLDDNGNSFLFLSIANQTKSITAILYDLLKDNHEVIFSKNNQNQTLLWQIAQSQDKEMCEKILPKIIEYYKKDLLTEKFWFLRDTDGNTPIHAAITPNKTEVLSYLLNTIQSTEEKQEIIFQLNNLTNIKGDTPLHIACKMKNIQAIILLTKYGADWTVVNDKKKSVFYYFCKLQIESQLMLMSLLAVYSIQKNKTITDRSYQYYVLNIYQKNLLNNLNNNMRVCKENYLKLAGLVSLKSLIIANMATNIQVKNALVTNSIDHMHFPHENEIEPELEAQNPDENVIIDIDTDNNVSSLLEQKNFDRAKFSDFINEVDAYILDLENNHRPSILPKLILALIIINWLIFWGTEGWMIHEKLRSNDLTNCSIIYSYNNKKFCEDNNHPASLQNQSNASTQITLFSIGYGFFSVFISLIPCMIQNCEGLITKDEWKNKIIFLDEILLNLQNLSHGQLPIDHNETLQQLQTAKNELRNYQPKIEVIDIFKRISQASKKIREYLNLGFYSNNLTLFKLFKQEKHLANSVSCYNNLTRR
jgi:ankyrin repeat protein